VDRDGVILFRASKHLALGSWNTQVSYDDVKVVDGNGNTLFFDDFSSDKGWTASSGIWGISDGIKTESGNSTPALIVNSKSLPDNYTITLKARKNGGDEGFLVGFQYFDSDDYSWWNIAGWGKYQECC
jgi:alpha-L-arabinofuranosidase